MQSSHSLTNYPLKKVKIKMIKKISYILILLLAFSTLGAKENKKALILPFKIFSEEKSLTLQEGINSILLKRFEGFENFSVSQIDVKDTKLDKNQIIKIGLKESADFVISGSALFFGGGFTLDINVFNTKEVNKSFNFHKNSEDKKELLPFLDEITEDIKKKLVKVDIPQNLKKEEFTFTRSKKFKLNVKMKRVCAGDIDGDKKIELIASCGKDIYIFKYTNNEFKRVYRIKGKLYYDIIGLDAKDINQNGKAEIFVNLKAVHNNLMDSFVLELQGKDFIKISEKQNFNYKIVGNKLYGQKGSYNSFFENGIYNLNIKDKNYYLDKKEECPEGISIYGFMKGLGKTFITKNEQVAFINKYDEIEFISDEKKGATNIYIEKKDLQYGDFEERFYLPHKLYIKDINGDNIKELIILNNPYENKLFGKGRTFTHGFVEVFDISKDSATLKQKSKKIEGLISDYVVSDIDSDGINEIVLSVTNKKKSYFLTLKTLH